MKTLIISIFAAALLVFNPLYAQPCGNGYMGRGFLRLGEKLDLTEDQRDKIEDLRSAHQKEVIDMRADLEKVQLKIRDMKRENTLNRNEYLSAVEEMNSIRNKISLSDANFRMDVYDLLTDKQKEEFNDLNFGQGRIEGRRGMGFRQKRW